MTELTQTSPVRSVASAPEVARRMPDPDIVYIMSPSYSGSTLLTLLLGTHPDIATIGELKATAMGDVEAYACSCGMPFRECSFWQSVQTEVRSRGGGLDFAAFGTHFAMASNTLYDRIMRARVRGRPFELLRSVYLNLHPRCRRVLCGIVQQNRLLMQVITEIQGARIVLDASKDPVRLGHLRRAGHWDMKPVHLMRDGRGTSFSYMKNSGLSVECAASEWRRTHQECERIGDRLPRGTVLRVHYEALCTEPAEILARVFRFIGVDPGQGTLDFQSREHHVLGNQMRLTATASISLNDQWRTSLTPDDLRVFDAVAGELNRKYGYE